VSLTSPRCWKTSLERLERLRRKIDDNKLIVKLQFLLSPRLQQIKFCAYPSHLCLLCKYVPWTCYLTTRLLSSASTRILHDFFFLWRVIFEPSFL
jgi:hypothetical protein